MLPKTARVLQKFFDQYDAIPDWDTLRTQRTPSVMEIVLPEVEGDILEIGAHEGLTTGAFCESAQRYDRNVIVVDPWDGRQQGNNSVFARFNENTEKYDNLAVHRMGSEDPRVLEALLEDDIRFAFILIDGMHSYDGVSHDIKCYTKLLQPGGVVCLDDWHGPYGFCAGIRKAAVEQIGDDYHELASPDSFIERYFVKLS